MTTPRDDIAGLSEVLRDRTRVGAYVQPTHLHSPDYAKGRILLDKAATQLDALSASAAGWHGIAQTIATVLGLPEPESDFAGKARDKFDALESRALRAEQERDTAITDSNDRIEELNRELDAFHRHEQTLRDNGIGSHTEAVVLVVDLRRQLKLAQQERDEAYERAADLADCYADQCDAVAVTSGDDEQVSALRSKEQAANYIAVAIRRLAAGAEKENGE